MWAESLCGSACCWGAPWRRPPSHFPHRVPHGGAAFLILELQPLAGWVRLGAALLIPRASNQVSTGAESGWHPHRPVDQPPLSAPAGVLLEELSSLDPNLTDSECGPHSPIAVMPQTGQDTAHFAPSSFRQQQPILVEHRSWQAKHFAGTHSRNPTPQLCVVFKDKETEEARG